MQDGKGQGSRSDLHELAEKVKNGASDFDIATENPGAFCRYYRGFGALRSVIESRAPAIRDPLDVTVIVGGTGVGKTFWCFSHFPDLYRVKYPESAGHAWWWDGYVSQETVLFDEFDGTQVALNKMLQYLDRYPITVQTHSGGLVPCKYKRVFLTTNVQPDAWYNSLVMDPKFIEQKAALARRLSRVITAASREDLHQQLSAIFPDPMDVAGAPAAAPGASQ